MSKTRGCPYHCNSELNLDETTHYCLKTLTSKLITNSPSDTTGTLTVERAIWRERIRAVGRSLGPIDHFCNKTNKKTIRLSYKHTFTQKLNFLCPYSETPHYRHLLNTNTSLLRTVCFVPGERNPYIFPKFNPLNTDTPLIQSIIQSHSVNTDTEGAIDSVCIHGMSVLSGLNL